LTTPEIIAMTRKISFKQAINEAIAQEMARDETVIAM
jgi:hypothetical protein